MVTFIISTEVSFATFRGLFLFYWCICWQRQHFFSLPAFFENAYFPYKTKFRIQTRQKYCELKFYCMQANRVATISEFLMWAQMQTLYFLFKVAHSRPVIALSVYLQQLSSFRMRPNSSGILSSTLTRNFILSSQTLLSFLSVCHLCWLLSTLQPVVRCVHLASKTFRGTEFRCTWLSGLKKRFIHYPSEAEIENEDRIDEGQKQQQQQQQQQKQKKKKKKKSAAAAITADTLLFKLQ